MSRRNRSPSGRQRRRGAPSPPRRDRPAGGNTGLSVAPVRETGTLPPSRTQADRAGAVADGSRRRRGKIGESTPVRSAPSGPSPWSTGTVVALAASIGVTGACVAMVAGHALPTILDPRSPTVRPGVAALLAAVALGMRVPGRVASFINHRSWSRPPEDRDAESVEWLWGRVESPDSRLLWTVLSVALLLCALALAVFLVQMAVASRFIEILRSEFVWSDAPAHLAQLVISFAALLPQGLLLGVILSLVQRLPPRDGLGVGAWTLAGAGGALSLCADAKGGLLRSVSMGLLLLGAILAARIASTETSGENPRPTRSPIQLPSLSDVGRGRWNVGLGLLAGAAFWTLATLSRWSLPTSMMSACLLFLLLPGLGLPAARKQELETPSRTWIAGYGAACEVAALLLVLAALVPIEEGRSGGSSWTLKVLLAAALVACGFDLARIRRISLIGAASPAVRDRTQAVRGLTLAALVAGLLEPIWHQFADTRLEAMLPPIVLLAVAGAIVMATLSPTIGRGRWKMLVSLRNTPGGRVGPRPE